MNRGLRNNNPGNIERTDEHWQGMSDDQSTDERFIVFRKPKWGIRAIARTLLTYHDHREAADGSRIDTPLEIAQRWAPSHENPTNDYAIFIAVSCGVNVTDEIDLHDYEIMRHVVCAIIHFENGEQPYDEHTIKAGLTLAGIDAPQTPISQSRTLMASTVATGATVSGGIVSQISDISAKLQPFISIEFVKYALLGLTLLSVAVIIYARIDDHVKEKR
jgi:hypothetical protein